VPVKFTPSCDPSSTVSASLAGAGLVTRTVTASVVTTFVALMFGSFTVIWIGCPLESGATVMIGTATTVGMTVGLSAATVVTVTPVPSDW